MKNINSSNNKIKIGATLDYNFINYYINKYPELTSGRKNYLKKEIEISTDICLVKLFRYSKRFKRKSIQLKKIIHSKTKVTVEADMNY